MRPTLPDQRLLYHFSILKRIEKTVDRGCPLREKGYTCLPKRSSENAPEVVSRANHSRVKFICSGELELTGEQVKRSLAAIGCLEMHDVLLQTEDGQ
jgi:hypothetical protein